MDWSLLILIHILEGDDFLRSRGELDLLPFGIVRKNLVLHFIILQIFSNALLGIVELSGLSGV